MTQVRGALGIAGLTLCLAWAGCSESGRGGGALPRSAPAADPGAAAREQTHHATIRVEVADVAAAVAAARRAADLAEGYVETSTVDDERASLELRVPAAALPATRDALSDLGHVTWSGEERQDVTLAHADLRARIASARAEEERLAEMFSTRTATLADVLAVEHELARVREQIEVLDAQDRATQDRVAMARVTLDVSRAIPGVTSEPLAFVARSALAGAHVAATLVVASAGALAALAPSSFVLALAAWVGRRAWRRASRAAS